MYYLQRDVVDYQVQTEDSNNTTGEIEKKNDT